MVLRGLIDVRYPTGRVAILAAATREAGAGAEAEGHTHGVTHEATRGRGQGQKHRKPVEAAQGHFLAGVAIPHPSWIGDESRGELKI